MDEFLPNVGDNFEVITFNSGFDTPAIVDANPTDGITYSLAIGPTSAILGIGEDCNGNSIPDVTDLSQCMGDPDCDDCDGNGILDTCDISACENQSCDDCNLNGVPDCCDVGDCGCVDDACIPTECVAALAAGDWTDGANWPDLLMDQYPDGDGSDPNGVGDLHVTLDGAETDVLLDESVSIHSLRILAGAALNVTQNGPEGDLLVSNTEGADEGNSLIEGNNAKLLVAGDRLVSLENGRFVVAGGGTYQALPGAQPPITATLSATEMHIREGVPGGRLELSDEMVVVTLGDFTMNGLGAGTGASCTPPILTLADQSLLDVGGDFNLIGDAEVSVGPDAVVMVGGSFSNHAWNADDFSWLGELLVGAETPFVGSPKAIEAASTDEGSSAGALDRGFALEKLRVASGTIAKVTDLFDNNRRGQPPLGEALYVRHLVLEQQAAIQIDGCRVYYSTIENQGARVTLLNSGQLVRIGLDSIRPEPVPLNGEPCTSLDDPLCPDESTCIASAGDTYPGTCYVPRNRYLSIAPFPKGTGSLAIRIQLDGTSFGWIGMPKRGWNCQDIGKTPLWFMVRDRAYRRLRDPTGSSLRTPVNCRRSRHCRGGQLFRGACVADCCHLGRPYRRLAPTHRQTASRTSTTFLPSYWVSSRLQQPFPWTDSTLKAKSRTV